MAELYSDNVDDSESSPGERASLWTSILEDVSKSSTRLPESKNVILLGTENSGKNALIEKLIQRKKREFALPQLKQRNALSFNHMPAVDEATEDVLAQMGFCSVSGHGDFQKAFQFMIRSDNLSKSLALILVDMSEPWTIIESLEKWTSLINSFIDSLGIDPRKLKELEERVVYEYQTYIDPSDSNLRNVSPGGQQIGSSSPSQTGRVLLPLGDNVLTHNLGIPVIVLVTKTDVMTDLEKDFDYKDEQFDYIQQSIRKFCLKYGAALFYTSVKEDKNISLLYQYIVHKLYRLPFSYTASVVDRDSIFIPAGWDNENKIAYLNDHLRTIQSDESYNAVITRPTFMKPKVDPEPDCDEDQLFLIDVETCIEKYEKTPHRATAPSTHSQPNLSKSVASSRTPSKGPPDSNANREPGDTMISQFFNALLNKKGTSPNNPSNVSQNSSTTSAPNISQTQS
eukprot:TRINITY_DN491_c0_g1_i1.p1 TRINITY_DN491_c0_g1~~TRINITY_DN491_c0_g1_i1.p1  ORF type:complete len:484 (-),score=100.41 TRINITY_DN491_c0_g1_i1:181-1545(-)